nr:immunoglobulin heavy chain junction region [Macaca mulatta]MOV53299.1 immunoglobulin heavy chain junction region [Macaca mulatta]MOV53382.1 immunoglobulin heavy chain junction region [Macaca mulatta]MOV53409.1 immunoglobulin heavy chain junction region [Macaca mulatta]MOV53411.1 immunoglobulin heavy chain junction region [Macaca mulatta]
CARGRNRGALIDLPWGDTSFYYW